MVSHISLSRSSVSLSAGRHLARWILSQFHRARSFRAAELRSYSRSINVRDGQSVKVGDALVELDPTIAAAELGHLKNDLLATRFEAARLRAALAGSRDPTVDFHPPEGATPDAIEMHRRFLASQVAEQNAKLQEIRRQESQKEAERETIRATINKLGETIPLLQERVNVRKYLTEKELGSKLLGWG